MQPKKINAYQRGRLLAIAALALEVFKPSAREWRIIRRSTNRCPNPVRQLQLLMIEACAPSRECAAPNWFWALTRETDCSEIIRARLDGYLPAELVNDAAIAAAAVVFGASVTIKRWRTTVASPRGCIAISDCLGKN